MLNRRTFLRVAGATAAALPPSLLSQAYSTPGAPPPYTDKTVSLAGDAAPTTEASRVAHLVTLLQKYPDAPDRYLHGGSVGELEHAFATLLGKEDAVFLPTGTLANNLAVRILCGDSKHALVQAESHLYADESDSASILSGLTLVPLAPGKAAPSYEEVAEAIDSAEHRPYPLRVGAISLESPVRRCNGSSVPHETLARISALAKQKGIGMHWDGARSLLLAGTPGFDIKSTSGLFDTVYVSLYKYLGAPFGAILAGRKEHMAQARDLRHIYGSLIYTGWATVLPPLDALPGFTADFVRARQAMDQLLARLQAAGGFSVERVANESNITHLQISPERMKGFSERQVSADVFTAKPNDGRISLFINQSILRRPVDEIASALIG